MLGHPVLRELLPIPERVAASQLCSEFVPKDCRPSHGLVVVAVTMGKQCLNSRSLTGACRPQDAE